MKQEDLEAVVLKLIRAQIQLFTDSRELCLSLNKRKVNKTKYKIYCTHIRDIKSQIDKYVGLKASLYSDFVDGIITQDDYISMGQQYAQKADELRIFLAELEREAVKYSLTFAAGGSWAQLVEKYHDIQVLTEEVVDAFIDEITLYNNGHIDVKFNFKDEMDEVIHLAAIRRREVDRYAI